MRDDRLLETLLDGAAAVWIAACVSYAAALGALAAGMSSPLLFALCTATLAGGVTIWLLGLIERPRVALPSFHVVPLEVVGEPGDDRRAKSELLLTADMVLLLPELLLTRAQMLFPDGRQHEREALLLDDVLAEVQPDSRVVQLFDVAHAPTPGELKSRIDQHLGRSHTAPADVAQALYDALADLRRSLG